MPYSNYNHNYYQVSHNNYHRCDPSSEYFMHRDFDRNFNHQVMHPANHMHDHINTNDNFHYSRHNNIHPYIENPNMINYPYHGSPNSISHMPESKILLKCDECPKLFCSREYLILHKQNKHPKKEIVYVQIPSPSSMPSSSASSTCTVTPSDTSKNISETFCEFCQRNFCNKYFLIKHKQSVHGKQDEMINDDSNSVIEMKIDGQAHSNNSFTKKNWSCNICNLEYYSFKYLENHMKRKHKNLYQKSNLIITNQAMKRKTFSHRNHIYFHLKQKLEKQIGKYSKLKKLPTNSSIYSLVKLSKFLFNYSAKITNVNKILNWKQKYSRHVLHNTKSYPLNSTFKRRSAKLQEFDANLETSNLPKSIIERLKIPKIIKLPVKGNIHKEFSLTFLLKPIAKLNNKKKIKLTSKQDLISF